MKIYSHPEYSNKTLELHEVRNSCKELANDKIDIRPNKIIRKVLEQKDVHNLDFEAITNVRRTIYNKRRKTLPTLAKSRKELIKQLLERNNDINIRMKFFVLLTRLLK